MEILEHGNKHKCARTFLCTMCWCKFRAKYGEYKDDVRVDGGHVHPIWTCTCPECGYEAHSDGSLDK